MKMTWSSTSTLTYCPVCSVLIYSKNNFVTFLVGKKKGQLMFTFYMFISLLFQRSQGSVYDPSLFCLIFTTYEVG